VESNSLAHRLSYVVLGEQYYLAGHGRGSSYVLENYFDKGYWGILLYGSMLGIFLSTVLVLINRNTVLSAATLYCLSQVYLIPRAEATSFLTFLTSTYFWATVLIYLMAFLCMHSKAFLYINKKLINKKDKKEFANVQLP
jgi:hypothetical protein